jgi:hypothetical protein
MFKIYRYIIYASTAKAKSFLFGGQSSRDRRIRGFSDELVLFPAAR